MSKAKSAAATAKRAPAQPPLPLRWTQRLTRNRTFWRDLGGLALIALGAITLLSVLGWNAGGIIATWAAFLSQAFGAGAVLLGVSMIAAGVPMVLNSRITLTADLLGAIIGAEVAFLALLGLIHSLTSSTDGLAAAQSGASGGATGWVLARLVWDVLGSDEGLARLASIVFWLALFAAGAFMAARPLLMRRRLETSAETRDSEPIVVIGRSPEEIAAESRHKPAPPAAEVQLQQPTKAPPAGVKSQPTIIRNEEKKAAAGAKKKAPKKPVAHGSALPPISLLKLTKEAKNNDADVQRQADVIETTLAHFGLAGKVVEIRRGPTVTQYGIEPGYLERPGPNGEKRMQKIRVSQIANLHNDFALALEAPSIRIEAPIPGRGLVGIEVPNVGVGAVDLRGVMESETFQKIAKASPLAIGLGRDVSGSSVAADLSRMPHLLIAGTTGSGKSVCISAIISCLAVTNRPEDLKLVLIDPKMVELIRFVGLPHIIGKPESDLERIPGVLRWVTREMDSRYKKFAHAGARNLADYNDMLTRHGEETLPRIVVLIDELADLMLQSPIETEKTICRLAQMARATGIHLVVATQRPSVDVVTGLIKANFPARISFAVASSTDSRVILDQVGAETLLGRGDMLFLNPESGHPQRLQGCFVSDREVEALGAWWKKEIELEKAKAAAEEPEAEGEGEAEEEYVANKKPELETPWDIEIAELQAERAMAGAGKAGRGAGGAGGAGGAEGGGEDSEDDELIKRAIDIIQTTGSPSTSLLQRKLRIGYPRAARLMEELQEMGYVGAASKQAGKGREVKGKDELE